MKLKVYSGAVHVDGRQVHCIVAATSIAKAVDAMKQCGILETVSHVSRYWSVTGNVRDIATATELPGTVFVTESYNSREYKPLAPRAPKLPSLKNRSEGSQP